MAPMIEMLEDRRFLSVTMAPGHHVETVHRVAVTAPVKQDLALSFKGTAVASTGKLAANLDITVRKVGDGYRIEITGYDPKGGTPTVLSGVIDAKGYFTCDAKTNGKLHVVGQVNLDKKTVSGQWTETDGDGTKQGTFSATQTQPAPAPTPAPKPTPTPVTAYHFQGTSTDDKGHSSPITMTVTKDASGYRAELHFPLPGGKTQSIVMPIDSTGHFVYDNASGGVTLHIEGKVGGDPAAVSGSWTSTRTDGSSHGSFAMSLVK